MQKGITPVVAIILLLLITVSITGFAFMFFTRTAQTSAQRGEQQLEQQTQQFGVLFTIESVERNRVYIRNAGTSAIQLSSLAFYVDNQLVEAAGPSTLNSSSVGTYFLNDSKLAMLPDPANLKVTGGAFSDSQSVCFYCNYYAGYWKFDEGSGTTASDSSGNSNTGTLTNGPAWATGKYGSAVQFDGVDDYVVTAQNVGITGSGARTLTFWAMVVTNPADRSVIGWGAGATYQSFAASLYAAGVPGPWYFWGQGYDMSTGVMPTLGIWQHHTITFDGTTVRWYIDGNQVANAALPLLNTAASPLYIGRFVPGWMGYSNVVIDEVRILNVARSMTTS